MAMVLKRNPVHHAGSPTTGVMNSPYTIGSHGHESIRGCHTRSPANDIAGFISGTARAAQTVDYVPIE
jgi:hypothetical protein